ncbi:AAA family ATPase [Phocaeicola vulgatus]|jgi:AAA15 family ATPase/GTPase|uniref:AAA family ATPase n=1 Tax=Phocaeicola vulgatus TaxID=821 RepID=UPI000E49CDFA|nr:ATP-binding protein [Phocaeicola vulgatus]RGX11926.1 ATP-binding protein [Phocaeicola vulgatus]RHL58040.1 ATP-binding protein [Phocaeicola vulgatus]
MIAEFTVENFYSIRSTQKISFEPSSDSFMSDEYTYEVKDGVRLLKVGIIYGANASGKSNVLGAIEFFKMLVLRVPKGRNDTTRAVPFLLDETSKAKTTKMSMSFYVNQLKYILSFELDKKRIYSETLTVYESIRPTKLYSRSYDPDTDSSVIEFGTNLKMAKKNQDAIAGNTINNCSVLAAFGNSNVEKTKLNDVYDYFAKQVKDVLAPGMLLSEYVKRHLDKDKDGNLKKFILNFLKASDFNIEDVTLHEEEELITPELEQLIQKAPIDDDAKSEMLKKGKITNTELTFTHRAGNGSYELSEEYESNGTMRFLGMAVILNFLLKKNQFVPIDEVETSIHYELLSYFIKVFLANSNQTSQMLLTTHDINLLNEEFIRRDTIWFTDKDEQGETNVVRLSALGLHKNLSPYNAYKQGKLVKLPFLGSQYFDLND